MERYAILMKTKDSLEVKVSSDKGDTEQTLRANRSNPSQKVLGCIMFHYDKNPIDIMKEFSSIYLGGGQEMKQASDEIFASVEYPVSFEPTIAKAFVDYFSERT